MISAMVVLITIIISISLIAEQQSVNKKISLYRAFCWSYREYVQDMGSALKADTNLSAGNSPSKQVIREA